MKASEYHTPVAQSRKRVGVSEEEKKLSYYKYYERPLAPVPQEKLDILNGGPAPAEAALPFEKKNLFLAGEHDGYCTVGYGITAQGTGFVCNTTYMPHVTGAMLNWWFPWHSVGSDLRYKIWDPEDHYFARAYPAAYVVDPAVPMHEKTWGVDHHVMENVGTGPSYLCLHFKKPSDLGYDMSLIGTDACESMVCAVGDGSCPAIMTHKWHPYQDGVLFESRFWIGYKTEGTQAVSLLPPGASIPPDVPKGLFAHNIKEFTNLAAILPTLYIEERETF